MLWKSEFFHMTEQLFQARLIGILIKICYTGSMENIKMLVSSMIRKEDGAFASFLSAWKGLGGRDRAGWPD